MRTHSRLITHTLLVAALAVLGFVLFTGSAVRPQSASAQAGPAFSECVNVNGKNFLSQGSVSAGTQLFLQTDTGGGAAYAPLGAPVAPPYNAMGYNTADNFLYAVQNNGGPGDTPAVLRIDSTGAAEALPGSPNLAGVGGGVNNGAFNEPGTPDADVLYVANSNNQFLYRISTTTGLVINEIPMSQDWPASDFAFLGGFLWGLVGDDDNVPQLWRLNPQTGAVSGPFNTGIQGETGKTFGAAWTYGNGNLGYNNNNTGNIYQIHVVNPAAASPQIQVVQSLRTPRESGNNDGAACPGPPVDLSTTKTAPATVDPGGTITWQITVHNGGPGDSSGYVVDDDLPAAVGNPQTSTPGCTITGHHLTCNGGPLPSGGDRQITVTADAPSPGTCVDNVASVNGHERDPDASNNTSAPARTCPPESDLSISKSGPATVDAGGTINWTLTVHNSGPDASTGYTVTDEVPAGVTNVQTSTAGCSVAGNTVTCTAGGLANGADAVINLSGTAPQSSNTCVTNSARVQGANADPTASNDTSNDSRTCTPPHADLSLTKSIDPDSLDANGNIVAGTNVRYTLVVLNNGPDGSPGGTVTDQLPSGLTYVSDDGNCTRSGQTLSCPVPALGAGSTTTIHVVASTPPDATGCVVNTADVTSDPGVVDPTGNNHADSGSRCFVHRYDLSLAKAIDPASLNAAGHLVAGLNATYVLTVANAGPSQSAATAVSDTLPSTLSFVSSPDGCTGTPGQAGATVTCPVGALGPNADQTFHIVTRVSQAATGCIVNLATVPVPPPDTDPNPSNNTAGTPCIPVDKHADLSIQKSPDQGSLDGSGNLVAGTDATYNLIVTNNGPSDSPGGSVVDDLPAGLSYVSNDAGCSNTGNVVTCPVGPLAVGATHTIHLRVHVAASQAECVDNEGRVSQLPDATDPNAANNTDGECTPVTRRTDLSITKAPDPASLDGGEIVAGTDVRYNLVVTNHGPSDSPAGATVTDTLPATLTYVSDDAGCSRNGQQLSCPVGALTNGATRTIHVTLHVDPAVVGCVDNTGTVNTAPNTTDPNPTNNTNGQCTPTKQESDLSIVKSIDPASLDPTGALTPGTDVTYILTVTNNGPSNAPGATVTDTLPPMLTYVSDDGMCTNMVGTLSCPVGPLTTVAPGNTKVIRITAHVDPSNLACVDNTGTVTVAAPATDPNSSNNASSTGCTPVVPKWDIQIDKRADRDEVIPGTDVNYEVEITNLGPSTATDEIATDPLPAGLSFVSATTGCNFADGTVTCEVPDLLPGGAETFGIVAHVDPAATGTIDNIAHITPPPDGSCVPATCEDNAEITLTPRANLEITKDADADPVIAGTDLTYELVVTNQGPSQAEDVIVTDSLPPQTTFVSADEACVYNEIDVTCTGPALPPEEQQTFKITVHVLPSATDTVENTATVTSTTECIECPPPATKIVKVEQETDLAITKTASQPVVTAGGQASYTLVVTNNGPSDATGVTVTDEAPGGLTIVSASPSKGSCGTLQPLSCTIGSLAVGASAQILLTANVAPGQTGELPNTARVTGEQRDPHPENNVSRATVTVVPPPPESLKTDLEVTKKVNRANAVLGTRLTYTITVVNHGPDTASGTKVTDTPGEPMRFVSATTTAGTCNAKFPLTCTIGTLPPEQTVTIKVVAIPLRVGTTANTATTTSENTDPNPRNNTDTAKSKLKPALALAKVAGRTSASRGQLITYRLKATNRSSRTLKNVGVCDQMPEGLAYVRSNPKARLSQGRPCWTVKRLRPHGSASFTIVAKVLAGRSGKLVNRAVASARGLQRVHARAKAVAIRGGNSPSGGVTG